MESDRPLFLCGYEAFQDFGFALPLYKTSPTSNAWYTHIAVKPFDLASRVSGFELFHPEYPCILGETPEVYVGDQVYIVFFWNSRAYVHHVCDILDAIGNRRELENYAPISLADLLLYSRSLKFGVSVKKAYRYIRQRFGRCAAERWFFDVLIKQAVKIDLDQILGARFPDDELSGISGLADAFNNIRVAKLSSDMVTIVYPAELERVQPANQLDLCTLTFTRQACRAAGKELEFRSGQEFLSELIPGAFEPSDSVAPQGENYPGVRPVLSGAETQGTLIMEVSGQGLDVGDALRRAVSDRFVEMLRKFGILDGKLSVTFSKGPHDAGFECALRYWRRGMWIVASGRGVNAHSAMAGAIHRARNQMRKRLWRGRFDHRR